MKPTPAVPCAKRLEQRLQDEIANYRRRLVPDATVIQFGSGALAADGRRGTDLPAVFVAPLGDTHALVVSGQVTAWSPETTIGTPPRRMALAGAAAPVHLRAATVGEALDYLAGIAPGMAQQEDERLTLAMELVTKKLRAATRERAVETWPWTTVVNFSEEPAVGFTILGYVRRMALAAARGGAPDEEPARARFVRELYDEPMPADVAPLDALRWVRDGLNALAKGNGDRYEEDAREFAQLTGGTLGPTFLSLRGEGGPSHLYLTGRQLAWTYSALAGVRRDQERPAFKAPANQNAHAVVAMLVRPPRESDREADVWTKRTASEADLILTWEGKTKPYQLKLLGDDDADLGLEIAEGLVRELGPDALRDWMALLRLASKQGATGEFRWTWEEHRDGTHYADIVRAGNRTDAELAKEVRQRIWRMKRAELWATCQARDGKLLRQRIGPFGLVDVDAEILAQDGAPIAVRGRFNPNLYAPKGPRAEKAGFTLLPDSALTLRDKPFRIYSAAVYQMRRAHGVARMKARTLWEYAGIAESQRQDRRRWAQCRRVLERALGELKTHEGVAWNGGGDGPDAVYELTAPAWWTDRLVHGVGPVLAAPATVGVPRTGPELAAMRKARGLSQAAIAAAVGVTQSAVSRVEKSPTALPPAWLPKLAAAKLTAG